MDKVENETNVLPFIVAIAIASLTIMFTYLNGAKKHTRDVFSPTDIVVPRFNLIDSISGKELTELDLTGSKYILNVWASWCVACQREHELLNQLAEKGVRIVGLNYRDDPYDVKMWLSERGNPYSVNLLDRIGSVTKELEVIGAPETFVVDSSGNIIFKHVGLLTKETWEEKLFPMYMGLKK